MLNSRWIEVFGAAMMILAVVGVVAFPLFGERIGIAPASAQPAYLDRLFAQGRVHTVDIQMDGWDEMIAAASEDAYDPCTVVIDGESFDGAGIRIKGNNSRSLVSRYGLERYSLKVEFDHFKEGASYHGLDKFSLDAAFQDNSYLKNYLAYDMMAYMEVPSPACSFAWVTVNGEPWGLFLAVEEPEESFAKRHFGPDFGALYKPDYRSLDEENADVALRYTGDDPALYDNIFRKALVPVDESDQRRLIEALRVLTQAVPGNGTPQVDLSSAVMIEETLRYFVVQSFTVNLDSYLGPTGHNYLLYEEDGRIRMLPWDYNLAFATYTLGMPEAENNPVKYVNQPIDTPADGAVMRERPLYHHLMQADGSFERYYELYDEFIAGYFESGRCEATIREAERLIALYVQRDPTAFCSYEDFRLGVDALDQFCALRAESVRGQLEGSVPSSFAEQEAGVGALVDTGDLRLTDLGEIADLENGVH